MPLFINALPSQMSQTSADRNEAAQSIEEYDDRLNGTSIMAPTNGEGKPLLIPSACEPGLTSIIIVTRNSLDQTRKCVESIRRHTPEHHEIIFVDNGSTAETVQWLQKLVRENGHYKLIENKTNLGFAKGCNQGAHVASGNYLLFLNNDTEPQAGWLEPLVNVLERDPSVAAVGSRLLFPDGTIQHAGVLILDDRKLPDPLVARHIYYGHASDMAEANQAKVYQALTGACILVRREAFNQVEIGRVGR
jgi:GT2 family glycosyltransferase